MANMHRIEIISSPARIHLPSSRCPAPGTSQPASSASIGGTRLTESSTIPLSPATRGYCTFVAIQTHHTSQRVTDQERLVRTSHARKTSPLLSGQVLLFSAVE